MGDNRRSHSKKVVVAMVALGGAVSLSAEPKDMLLLSGQSTDVPVIFVSGHPYVGLEALARELNGSLSTAQSSTGSVVARGLRMGSGGGTKTAVSSPPDRSSAGSASAAATTQAAASSSTELSRTFMAAGIAAMSAVRG